MLTGLRGWWIVGLVGIAACGLGAHPPPAPPRQTALGLSLSRMELSNGLQVVLVRDPRAAEIQVTMRYQVGSVDDPPDQAGIAHLVEHLMFQQVLGGQSLFAKLEQIATSFNAETSFGATAFFERAQGSHLDELLSVEAVRIGFRCTSITESAFVREREVVVNELRQRDGSREVWAALDQSLYPAGHPYLRPVGGSEASVSAITRDQACAFADAHYAPKNAVLVVSGDLTPEQLRVSLGKFLARVAKRSVAPPAVTRPISVTPRRVDTRAPIDDPLLVATWALPDDPRQRAIVRAVAAGAARLIDPQIKGHAVLLELGDGPTPMITMVVVPGANEPLEDALTGFRRALGDTPAAMSKRRAASLGERGFDSMQQSAIYELYARQEDGSDRDLRIASYVGAGRDPSAALGAEFTGLRELTRDEAARISRDHLSFDRATIVVVWPSESKKRGLPVELAAAIHDLGQHRDPPDPAEAHRPLAGNLGARGFVGVRTRELANGLKVVLLPLTTVPTIDMRLVFDAGTADEPADKRGAALVAGDALTWDPHFLNDLLLFVAAGGRGDVEVGADHTSFTAHGLDMHLDLLLAGLRRWVRDGRYRGDTKLIVDALRRESRKTSDEGILTDAWRTALFGAGHPYEHAGLVRHFSEGLTAADAAKFRAAHYAPDKATLVIAGHFDPDLAERWIDYLFADWTGHGEPRRASSPSSRPASIAKDEATTLVQLKLAFPAAAGPRASQLVAAEMLSEIASDVRHQLGASYGLDTQLTEARLATSYEIAGSVEAGRASDAVELIRARLAQLGTDEDMAARSFVSARSRVLTRLISVTGRASMLADRVEHDVELARAPISDLQTATAVQQLTIDAMTAALAELDLSHAVVLMRGPRAEIDRAFLVLGRTPTYVRTIPDDPAEHEPVPVATASREEDPLHVSDLADALTEQGPAAAQSSLTLTLATGYSIGRVIGDRGADGVTLAGEIGYRIDQDTALGLQLTLGQLGGSYTAGTISSAPALHPLEVLPLGAAAFIQATGYDRLWGAALLGVHLDRIIDRDHDESAWYPSFGVGLQGGVDIVTFRGNRLGAYVRVDSELVSSASYAALTLGLAYRR